MTTNPFLRWPGGKTRLLKLLLPLIRPHTIFVEAFAGGAALTLAKEPSKVEVINDINRELVNLYRYAQFHIDALVAEVEFTLNARADLEALIEQPGLTGLQQAARCHLCRADHSAAREALAKGFCAAFGSVKSWSRP